VAMVEREIRAGSGAEQEVLARAQLEALLECAPAFIIAVDQSGAIVFINRTLSNFRRQDVVGTPWLNYVPPEERARLDSYLRRVLETGGPEIYEVIVPGENGRPITFASYMGPMSLGDSLSGAVIVSQDVSEARLAQNDLAQSRQLAAIGTLAAGVAHEINTPVQFVSDSVQFLADASRAVFALLDKTQALVSLALEGASAGVLKDAAREAVMAAEQADLEYVRENVPIAFDSVLAGLDRVTNIVRSLKEFAHPASDEMSPVDLNRAIQSTVTVASNEYKYVADLLLELGDLPLVTCHVNGINQVVLNVLVNAAHAIADTIPQAGDKGLITVRTRCDGDAVVVSIGDTGPGIPEPIRGRIFDPFFTTKDVGRGTGQGLAIARTIVREKHGGELSFETADGVGTTFFIRLPIRGKLTGVRAST
jgi:PAS domain S-box-containing protein